MYENVKTWYEKTKMNFNKKYNSRYDISNLGTKLPKWSEVTLVRNDWKPIKVLHVKYENNQAYGREEVKIITTDKGRSSAYTISSSMSLWLR